MNVIVNNSGSTGPTGSSGPVGPSGNDGTGMTGPTGPAGSSSSGSSINAGIYGLEGVTGPEFQGYGSYGWVPLSYKDGFTTSTTDIAYTLDNLTIKTSGIYRIDVNLNYRLTQGPTGIYFGPVISLGLTGTLGTKTNFYPSSFSNLRETYSYSFIVPIDMAVYGGNVSIAVQLSASGDQGVASNAGISPLMSFDSDSTGNYFNIAKIGDIV